MGEPPDLSQLQDKVFELVRKSQEAILDAGRSFTDNVTAVAPGDTASVDRVIDDAFDFTERVLKTQRDFAKSVVQAISLPGPGGASPPTTPTQATQETQETQETEPGA